MQTRSRNRPGLFENPLDELPSYNVEIVTEIQRENDRMHDDIADKASVLKKITEGIYIEAQNHNKILDEMSYEMSNVRSLLNGVANKFKNVIDHKGQRNIFYIIFAGMFMFIALYLYFT